MKTIGTNEIRKSICNKALSGRRSAWKTGVALYALEIIKTIEEETDRRYLILTDDNKLDNVHNGFTVLNNICTRYSFETWKAESWGGCYLIYNQDIAKRLCTPSEYKKAEKNEFIRANSREDWLDVQGRALYQASEMIKAAIREEIEKLIATEAA
jgi:hypothetical protein